MTTQHKKMDIVIPKTKLGENKCVELLYLIKVSLKWTIITIECFV